MLQQTQVSTVIPYYERFMQKFPDIHSLARAKEDNVLHLWTGLGYYARARNLHKTAKIITTQYKSIFPDNLDIIQTLPGIGRSTAGAIVSLAFKKRAAILDGNVKRVLCRLHALKFAENKALLWEIAEKYTPRKNTEHYTQAMMDLGAMLCTRTKPQCEICPLQKKCQAYKLNTISDFPGKQKSKIMPVKKIIVLILKNKSGEILLQKRPSRGIWGGLWSFPEFHTEKEIREKYKNITGLKKRPPLRHTFSHYHLDIQPIEGVVKRFDGTGFDINQPLAIGLAAPVKKLLFGA